MSQQHEVQDLAFDLHDRLHKSMRISGHTARTLGQALDVHRNTVSNYLTGRTQVDRRTLIAWAFATGVPVEWLENGALPDQGPDGTPGVTALYPFPLRDIRNVA
jgi:transcriptional regulator with XRE-family HTH domain